MTSPPPHQGWEQRGCGESQVPLALSRVLSAGHYHLLLVADQSIFFPCLWAVESAAGCTLHLPTELVKRIIGEHCSAQSS